MNETRTLCEFAAKLSYDKLPQNVIDMAKKCLIDYIGVAAFASQTEMGQIMSKVGKRNNVGSCTILPGTEHKYAPNMAAFVNGTFGHGFELDDINSATATHPGCEICSAAVAMAEECGADGKTLIEAIVVGYEVMVRCIRPFAKHHLDKGFHPTATGGTFGATAACCKVLGLNAAQFENALGIAGTFTSGIKQFTHYGSMSKRLHGGKGGYDGAEIAQLAKEGFTGPSEIFEGKTGFNRVFCDSDYAADFSLLTDGLGEIYAIEDITVKPCPACGVIHSVIDCLDDISKEPGFSKNFDAIEKIVVKSHHNMIGQHMLYEPKTVMQGQYSCPFTVGVYMEGEVRDAKQYLDDGIIKNPAILRWGEKVTAELDEEMDNAFPARFGSKVDVVLADGRTLHAEYPTPKGSGERQFTYDEVENKYMILTQSLFSEAMQKDVASKVRQLEKLENVRDLFVEA
ncbi:MAG: MmgE/PrpD family protein [Eubacteriales bacterium]|nr:MmgE/PrpD family protein [Eubacteriales bacterium]